MTNMHNKVKPSHKPSHKVKPSHKPSHKVKPSHKPSHLGVQLKASLNNVFT